MGDGFWYCDTHGVGQVGQHGQVCFNIKSAEQKNIEWPDWFSWSGWSSKKDVLKWEVVSGIVICDTHGVGQIGQVGQHCQVCLNKIVPYTKTLNGQLG